MKGYIVFTHLTETGGRRPLRAFALRAEDHHQAVALVRDVDVSGEIDVEAVLHLRDETAARLQLAPGDVWQL